MGQTNWIPCVFDVLGGMGEVWVWVWEGDVVFKRCLYFLFLESHFHSLKRCLKCNVAGEVRVRRET